MQTIELNRTLVSYGEPTILPIALFSDTHNEQGYFYSIGDNKMEEIWKDVVGYEQYYQVSNFGRVKSKPRKNIPNGNILALYSIPYNQYVSVTFGIDNEKRTFTVHRLVAMAFIPNPDNKKEVNHKNGIRNDNRVINLGWVTRKENNIHAVQVLNSKRTSGQKNRFGDDSWKAKPVNQLTPDGQLIKRYPSLRSTLEDFGDRVSISACCNGKKKTGLYMGFKWEWADKQYIPNPKSYHQRYLELKEKSQKNEEVVK